MRHWAAGACLPADETPPAFNESKVPWPEGVGEVTDWLENNSMCGRRQERCWLFITSVILARPVFCCMCVHRAGAEGGIVRGGAQQGPEEFQKEQCCVEDAGEHPVSRELTPCKVKSSHSSRHRAATQSYRLTDLFERLSYTETETERDLLSVVNSPNGHNVGAGAG